MERLSILKSSTPINSSCVVSLKV
ncbi:MAG: hypothetical protein HC945_00055 [Nitrosarchaeum sp.]|nr:hypothetical protein [Nitrosarchaeum sp.]